MKYRYRTKPNNLSCLIPMHLDVYDLRYYWRTQGVGIELREALWV
ncbi:hypothetical protein RSAG8_03583, partial [Rhizoctonia solani AG-8 WAC10335]